MFLLIVISACSNTYVCADGTTQKDPTKCTTIQNPTVTEREAEKAADNYGQAYALARNDRYTRVNTYKNESNWNINVLFTNIKTSNVAQITLQVDGKTESVTCISGCEYLFMNETNSSTQNNSTTN